MAKNVSIDNSGNLTDKQKAFCQEYLIDLNATKAAIRSGYSQKTARHIASENLAKPNIQDYIQELRKEVQERNQITIDEIVQELSNVVRINPKHFYDEDGLLKPLGDLTDEQAKALESMDIEIIEVEGRELKRINKFKFHNKIQAGNLLLKHLGGFEKDNSQKKTVVDLSKLDTETLLKLKDAGS